MSTLKLAPTMHPELAPNPTAPQRNLAEAVYKAFFIIRYSMSYLFLLTQKGQHIL